MRRRLLGALVLLVQLSAAQAHVDALGEAPGDSPGVRIVKDMLIEKALALARLKTKHTKQGHTEYVAALKQLQHDQAVLRERLLRYTALKHNEKNRSFSVGVPPVPSWQHFAAACAAISALFVTMLCRLRRKVADTPTAQGRRIASQQETEGSLLLTPGGTRRRLH